MLSCKFQHVQMLKYHFWATVCKTVRPMVLVCCLSLYPVLSVCLSVCGVRALWPNGWTDQDETWQAGRPRPWSDCVRWGPSSPSPKGAQPSPIFGPYLLRPNGCMVKMSLGMELGLSPGGFVLVGDPALPSTKRAEPPNFRPISIVVKWMHVSRCHLV